MFKQFSVEGGGLSPVVVSYFLLPLGRVRTFRLISDRPGQLFDMQVSVDRGCSRIVVADCFDLHEKLYNARRRGCSVDEQRVCGACRKCIVAGQQHDRAAPATGNALVFHCRHAFHEECMPSYVPDGQDAGIACAVCTDSRTEQAAFR